MSSVFRISPHVRCSKRLLHRLYSTAQDSPSLRPLGSSVLPNPRIDYRNISENVVYKSTNAMNRKAPLPDDAIQSIVRWYTESKNLSTALNSKRNRRSAAGERVRRFANENNEEGKTESLAEAKRLKAEIAEIEASLAEIEARLLTLSLAVPNDTHPSSPLGPEDAATIMSINGPDLLPSSPIRDHVTIGKKLGLIDLESGANVTGTSWYYLTNEGALMEMALINYAVSMALKRGFTPVTTPDVVRSDIAMRCGFQPRDYSDPPISQIYSVDYPTSTSASPELILSGTAEIPLAGMFANKILPPVSLPKKVVGIGRAFRAEAGARGTDTRGLYRVHQFSKVELFAVTTGEDSELMMEEMKDMQMSILNGLELPFRVLDMPSEELGASAYRKYDIEAWMPGRGKWGEVSSLSNCTDFQARRLLIRHSQSKPATDEHYTGPLNPFVHTLNGTAAAIPRLMVALIENGVILDANNEATGLRLPSVLKPFWLADENSRSIIQWT